MYLLWNKVSHEYFGIDYENIWDLALNYLPEKKRELEAIIEKKKNTSHNRVAFAKQDSQLLSNVGRIFWD